MIAFINLGDILFLAISIKTAYIAGPRSASHHRNRLQEGCPVAGNISSLFPLPPYKVGTAPGPIVPIYLLQLSQIWDSKASSFYSGGQKEYFWPSVAGWLIRVYVGMIWGINE